MNKNAVRANDVLAKSQLLFLFIIPILGLLYVSHNLPYSLEATITLCIASFVLGIIPFSASKIVYNDGLMTLINMVILELFCLYLFVNPYFQLVMLLLLTPAVTLLFCNMDLTKSTSVCCLLGSIIAVFMRHLLYVSNELNKAMAIDLIRILAEYVVAVIILTLVAGYLEGIFGQTDALESRVKQLESDVARERERTEKRVQNKQASDPLHLLHEEFDLQQFCNNIEQDILSMIAGKNKSFVMYVDQHLPVAIKGNAELLRSSIENICMDLLMYHTNSNVRLEIGFDSTLNVVKNMNVALVIKIFSNSDIRSFASDNKALGFFMTEKIVDELGGSFEEIGNDQETAFEIRVMEIVADDTTIDQRRSRQVNELEQYKKINEKQMQKSAFRTNIKALIVDDNRECRKLLDAVLNSIGISSDSAEDALEAMEMIQKKEYQLVLIDQLLPDKSGLETVKELRYMEDEYFKEIPIILLALNTNEDARAEYESIGLTDCIAKPIRAEQVKSVIHKWIKDDYPMSYEEYLRLQMENEQLEGLG